jgi:nitrile hydratase
VVTEAEIQERIARTDRASPEIGARMVARAWTDPDYRALMLRDGTAAAEAAGVSMAGMPPLGVLEDTDSVHHLVVCTLCSCYPRAVLGYPPHWYKSSAYRARAVRDPRGVLAEWGTVLADSTEIRVVDSTADYRWMVLPMRPKGTEGWSVEKLASIITRDALVGVAVPRV